MLTKLGHFLWPTSMLITCYIIVCSQQKKIKYMSAVIKIGSRSIYKPSASKPEQNGCFPERNENYVKERQLKVLYF